MFIKKTILLLIGFLMLATPSQAQDIETMLEKLKRIEEQLQSLTNEPKPVLQEPTLQNISHDIQFVRAELEKQITSGQLAQELQSLIQGLETRLQTLPESLEGHALSVPEEEPTVTIAGFGDVLRVLRQGDAFALGQVEVDIEASVDQAVVATAIAYDGAAFTVGAFEIILPVWGREEGHFRSVQEIVTSELSVGQFDVPFGLDRHVYPSIERKLITSPLVVEKTHDSWNDFGMRGYLETDYFKMDVFATNGFGYETIDASNNPIELSSKFALGGRLGIVPVDGFELGGSVAGIWDENDDLGMVIVGFDAQLEYQQFAAKGEYIYHQTGRSSLQKISNQGLYGQAKFTIDPVFLVARYDLFWPDGGTDESRLSAGVGYAIVEGCELRMEYQFNFDNVPDIGFVQIVVGF